MTDKTKNMIGIAVIGILIYRNISLMKQVKNLQEELHLKTGGSVTTDA
tara:strand:- start:2316 stop:2459 length:144 start_codon:yes stop_codon:yes gene_type:complete